MRIGIDYRMLSAGKNTVNRGMGRYTQQQLREALRADTDNEYVLLCRQDADAALILPEILAAPNVSLARFTPSSGWSPEAPNPPEQVLRLAEEYQAWVARQRIDLYHATTPFLFKDTVLHRFDACPMVATFYDLIPLIFPEQYLPPGAAVTPLYERALQLVSRADRLIAISQSARDDALRYLGIPAERIDIAYPIPDPWFQPLPEEALRERLQRLRRRVPLPDQYLLSVTYPHYSKNVERMLEGYGQLPADARRRTPLVLTFEITGNDRRHIQALTDRYGVSDTVVLTDFVSEDELVALYNGALALLHPSRYEGFGLPVVEAMRCGTPVITSTTSSLPEVGGDAAILVDPDDVAGIASAIGAVLESPARRAEMRERGLAHAARFEPQQLGRETRASYERLAADVAARRPDPRPHLALWTPLPPQPSGIADYATDLLRDGLDRMYDIEIFVDDGYLPAPDLLASYAIHHHSAFARRRQQRPFDAILYQLGASFFHLYMEPYILEHPGVVTLHDLLWSFTRYWRARNAGRIADFRRELRALEGDSALDRFDQIDRTMAGAFDARMERFLGEHFMLGDIVARSSALIVHTEVFAEEIRARYPGAPVTTILQGMEDLWGELPPLRTGLARERLGLPTETFIVGIFGIVDRIKRVDVAIRAFQQVCAAHPDSRLLIVGQHPDAPFVQELRDLAHDLGLDHAVVFVEYPEKEVFNSLILACDAVVNLRWPSRKQMSASLMRAISAGKPTIITGIPEWAFLPEEFCWRVAPDEREVATLAGHLMRLAASPRLRGEVSAAARAWYEACGTAAQMAAAYGEAIDRAAGVRRPLREVADPTPPPLSTLAAPGQPENPALAGILRDILGRDVAFPAGGDLWAAAMTVLALRSTGALHPDAAVLYLGAASSPLTFYLEREAGQVFAADWYLDPGSWVGAPPQFMLYDPHLAAPSPDPSPRPTVVQHMDGRSLRFPDAMFDAAVCSGVLSHSDGIEAVANTAYEVGRVLKPGGIATFTALYRLGGPPGGRGWPGATLLSEAEIRRAIIEASGLDLVDEPDLTVPAAPHPAPRAITAAPEDRGHAPHLVPRRRGSPTTTGARGAAHVYRGYAFCAVHLTLRKTERYANAENQWAKPGPAEPMTRRPGATPVPAVGVGIFAGLHRRIALATEESPMSGTAPRTQVELETALAEWDVLRHRGWYNEKLNRLPRFVGYLVRTVDRVLVLGRILGAQARIYQALSRRQGEIAGSLASVESRVEMLSAQLQHTAGDLATARQQIAAVTDQQGRLADQQGRLADQQGRLADQQGEVERALSAARAVDERAAGAISDLGRNLASLEDRYRRSLSELRVIQQHENVPVSDASPVSDADVRWLIQSVEQEIPSLRSHNAVELSIQDAAAEHAIAAGAAYLGERLASSGEDYRQPNDLWYHIDFTPAWDRPVLFESAFTRLARGGAFVLITDEGNAVNRPVDGLEQVHTTRLRLISGRSVRVFVWRRV